MTAFRHYAVLFTLFHGCLQGSDTDLDGAKVVSLIYLDESIELVGRLQKFHYLVGGDCVNAAAEGVQLYQVNVRHVLHHVGCAVKP